MANKTKQKQNNFLDPVPNLKVKSFSTMVKKTDWLLIAANSREINLKEVLSYELSSVPFALAHQDGGIHKTTKSVLAKMLENQVEVLPRLSPASPLETVHILDGMAIVQMTKSAGASTFGELASKYYTAITAPLAQRSCKEVHMVFDQYWETSIKGGERSRTGSIYTRPFHANSQTVGQVHYKPTKQDQLVWLP